MNTSEDYLRAVNIISGYLGEGKGSSGPSPVVVIVSAAKGVTESIIEALGGLSRAGDHKKVEAFIATIRERHRSLARNTLDDAKRQNEYLTLMDGLLMRLERLLHGIVLTEEITPRTRDLALSFGERFSAPLLAGALSCAGIHSKAVEADKAGLLTDGEFGNASVDPQKNKDGFRRHVGALVEAGIVPVVTGFFGADAQGRTSTFGRGGSDYSAAVIAAIFEAESLDIWKDVDGFMTADPKVIPFARTIERLSYQEAAELAYFGAKVIHPRTVEPLRPFNIPIRVLNSFKREEPGTIIAGQTHEVPDAIKSVAYTTDIAVLKVHGVGVGFKPGVLNDLAGALSAKGINIKSVITSQTCISLLIEGRDLKGAHGALEALGSHMVENLEDVTDIALVGVVGEGIVRTKGLAARAFTSVAMENVNVLMISAGASSAAYYFVVRKEDIDKVVKAVHAEFFA